MSDTLHERLICAIKHIGQVTQKLKYYKNSSNNKAQALIHMYDIYNKSKTTTDYKNLKTLGAEFLVTHKALTQIEFNKALITRDKLSTQYKLSQSIDNSNLANEGLLILLAAVQSM